MWQTKATGMNFSQLDQQPKAQAIFLLVSWIPRFSKNSTQEICGCHHPQSQLEFHSRVGISEIISASAFPADVE
jgi:hypothetical protein